MFPHTPPADLVEVRAFMARLGAMEGVAHEALYPRAHADYAMERVAFSAPAYGIKHPIASWWVTPQDRRNFAFENWVTDLKRHLPPTGIKPQRVRRDHYTFDILDRVATLLGTAGYAPATTAATITLYAECCRHWLLNEDDDALVELYRCAQINAIDELAPAQKLELAREDLHAKDLPEFVTYLSNGYPYALTRDLFVRQAEN